MKKLIFIFCLFIGLFAQAQNGLENIYVERYYVSNAADAAGSAGTLPVGSVTYRIYADMLPGYKAQSIYGSNASGITLAHPLLMTTTTTFFNNTDFGATIPTFSATNAKKNTVMLDSWLSTGGACAGFNGILKTEDNGVGNFVNTNGLLQNADPLAGIPLTTQDGMYAGTVPSTITLGLDAVIDIFGDGSANGNSFLVTDGAWACLAGAVGPTATNKVLLAQITTDGIFHFELNIQIGTPSGGTENYVSSNPTGVLLTIPSLIQTLYPVPAPPVVFVTSPTNGQTFPFSSTVALAATATDADGTITQVEFKVDGVSVGVDLTAPYTSTYSAPAVTGTHTITAIGTDNDGNVTTSAVVTINVGNAPPTVGITAPTAGTVYIAPDAVNITATAADADGTVSSVEFFVDGVSLGAPDVTAPYAATYSSVIGIHSLTAKAKDNNNAVTTSAPVTITVNANIPPAVAITSPVNGATPALNVLLTVTATATDSDGITSVEFFAGSTSLGIDLTAPYSIDYTPAAVGPVALTAKATDTRTAFTTSAPVNVVITDMNANYQIKAVSQPCNIEAVCMPLATNGTYSVAGVTGYNFTVQYDKLKVVPTGNVTVSSALIAAILGGQLPEVMTDYTTSIDAAAGKINIAIYFNSNAPSTASFNGMGDVCCVEFTKVANLPSTSVSAFSFTEIIESYPTSTQTKQGSAGNFTTYMQDNFAGSLKFWSDLSPIGYTPGVNLITNILGCGLNTPAVTPDALGNFAYSILNGTTIDIKRDILPATSVQPVINGQDAYLTSLISVKGTASISWTPSVYQMVAADVNRDGTVSAGDATQISLRAIAKIAEFSQVLSLGKDWSFVANTEVASNAAYLISTTFPENDLIGYSKYKVPVVAVCQAVPVTNAGTCPIISTENYMGILVGDVDGTYATAPASIGLKNATADTASIVIDLSKATFSNGNMSIPVSLISSEVVNSFDFQLVINDMVASVYSIESQNSNVNIGWNYIPADKLLLVTSYSMSPMPTANTANMILTLNGVSSISRTDLTEALSLVNGLAAHMVIIDATTGITDSQIENSVQVYPNPASDVLNVQVSVDAKVQMSDLNGKQVVAEQNVNANQKQTIDVSALAPGVYMVKIFNDKFVSVKKVIIK